MPSLDLIVLCDFGYGLCLEKFVNHFKAKEHKVLECDSQTSSQQGDITKFKDVNLITPTELEARSAFNRYSDSLTVVVDELYEKLGIENIVVTLGDQGIFCQEKPDRDNSNSIRSDQLHAISPLCVDSSGAGDAFLAASSLILATGGNIWDMSALGSLASAIQVRRLGNIPISKSDLLELI